MDQTRRAASTEPLHQLAPAKINLNLHIVGQRPADGYHLLESLVVFADAQAADTVNAAHASSDSFCINGAHGQTLASEADNLVLKARDWLRAQCGGGPIALKLDKRLPVASGIGGGSADAAAALRLLADLWQAQDLIGTAAYEAVCAALGADLAMCLESTALVARGIGENLTPVSGLPVLPAILINPGVGVATGAVFGALAPKTNAPLPALPDRWGDARAVADWLAKHSRNDLEAPALSIAPVIDTCISALGNQGALLARMSGSGATCFGLYATQEAAHHAAVQIGAKEPDWWVRATVLNSGTPTNAERDNVQA